MTGATTLGTAAYKMASDTAAAADEVDKASQRLGMSREAYQEWDYVLSQSGASIDSMSAGFKTLTNRIDEAVNGSDAATEMFGKLGISVEDLQSMSREDIFSAVISSMQGMEDNAERAALANDLLGKSGQSLAPLLNTTAESTEGLKNKAHELGMVMSDETVDAGVAFTDAVDTIQRSLGGMANSLGGEVLPIVQEVLDLIIERLPDIQALFERLSPLFSEVFDGVLPPLLDLAETLLPTLLSLLETLLPTLESAITAILPVIVELLQEMLPFGVQLVEQVLPILVELIEGMMPLFTELLESVLPVVLELLEALLPPALQIVEAVLPVLISLLEAVMPVIQPVLDIILLFLEPLTSLLDAILPPLIDLLNGITENVMPQLQKAVEFVADAVTGNFSEAFESLEEIFDNVIQVFEGVIEFVAGVFTGDWERAWNGIVDLFRGIFNIIPTIVENVINSAIDMINGIISGINWAGEFIGLTIPELDHVSLPRFRVGIDYVPYDEMPALLHKGERVLTAEENRAYTSSQQTGQRTEVKIEIGERAIYIENLNGTNREDLNGVADTLMELISEKIKRKGVVFG